MAYTYQTFTSGQVLTGAQMVQVEDNIRDHKHGVAGVGVVGLGYNVSSKGGAFSVAAADHGTLFLAAGDFDISMAAAGTLGATFGAGIKNIGSGRVAIKPNGSQLIDASSYFVLTPGEMVNVYSDGIGLGTFGNSFGPKLLWDSGKITSLTNLDITRCYFNDYAHYELLINHLVVSANGQVQLTVSTDSGSTFVAAGYKDDTTADTTYQRITGAAVGSNQLIYGNVMFANDGMVNIGALLHEVELSGAASIGALVRSNKWPISSMNAMRLICGGNFVGGRVQLWGYPRR